MTRETITLVCHTVRVNHVQSWAHTRTRVNTVALNTLLLYITKLMYWSKGNAWHVVGSGEEVCPWPDTVHGGRGHCRPRR